MAEPQTEAGRALLEAANYWSDVRIGQVEYVDITAAVAAVEAEAAAAERARLAALVEGLTEYEAIGKGTAIVKTGGGLLSRPAVLRILSGGAS